MNGVLAFFSLLFVSVGILPVLSQSGPDDFISIAGRFAIKLPPTYVDYKVFFDTEIGGKKFRGSTYRWNIGKDQVTVSYGSAGSNLEVMPTADAFLKTVEEDFFKKTPSASLVGERKTSLDGHPGLIFILQSDTGRTMYWAYLVKNRLYSLSLSLADPETIQENVKTVSTFRFATSVELDARNAKLIDQLTPEPLPLEARANRPTSDAQDMGLKGKVGSVIIEAEEFADGALVGNKGSLSDQMFNETGDLIKVVEYDGSMPKAVRLYGYLKGERVYKEKQKEEKLVLLGSKEEKTAEPAKLKTEIVKIKYKFDNAGRLAEMRIIDERGNEREKVVYSAGRVERTLAFSPIAGVAYLDKLGAGNKWKEVDLLDASGNVTETNRIVPDAAETEFRTIDGKVQQIAHDRYKTEIYKYQYELDDKGNWTKRTTISLKKDKDQTVETPIRVTYRTISYY